MRHNTVGREMGINEHTSVTGRQRLHSVHCRHESSGLDVSDISGRLHSEDRLSDGLGLHNRDDVRDELGLRNGEGLSDMLGLHDGDGNRPGMSGVLSMRQGWGKLRARGRRRGTQRRGVVGEEGGPGRHAHPQSRGVLGLRRRRPISHLIAADRVVDAADRVGGALDTVFVLVFVRHGLTVVLIVREESLAVVAHPDCAYMCERT